MDHLSCVSHYERSFLCNLHGSTGWSGREISLQTFSGISIEYIFGESNTLTRSFTCGNTNKSMYFIIGSLLCIINSFWQGFGLDVHQLPSAGSEPPQKCLFKRRSSIPYETTFCSYILIQSWSCLNIVLGSILISLTSVLRCVLP